MNSFIKPGLLSPASTIVGHPLAPVTISLPKMYLSPRWNPLFKANPTRTHTGSLFIPVTAFVPPKIFHLRSSTAFPIKPRSVVSLSFFQKLLPNKYSRLFCIPSNTDLEALVQIGSLSLPVTAFLPPKIFHLRSSTAFPIKPRSVVSRLAFQNSLPNKNSNPFCKPSITEVATLLQIGSFSSPVKTFLPPKMFHIKLTDARSIRPTLFSAAISLPSSSTVVVSSPNNIDLSLCCTTLTNFSPILTKPEPTLVIKLVIL